MATGCSKQGVEESHSNIFQTPRFFKIVVNPKDHRLRIPTNFVRRHGHTLSSNKVYLKAPIGSIREVGLVHSNGETWLHKGWKDFREYYSIKFGHLLVFQYAGNSHFDVLIFDMTATEIQYPPLHNDVGHEAIINFNSDETVNESDDNSNPHFEVVLTHHRKSRVCIRKHFAEAAGLIGRRSVSLEYEGGFRVDDVVHVNRIIKASSTLELTAGWPEFRERNGLVCKKTYSFEFIPERNVILVKQLESRSSKK